MPFQKLKVLEQQSNPLFHKLQLLEHAFLSRSKNNQVIGTLPPLPDFVTVISLEIARPRASVRSRTVFVSWLSVHTTCEKATGSAFLKRPFRCKVMLDSAPPRNRSAAIHANRASARTRTPNRSASTHRPAALRRHRTRKRNS